MTLDEHAVREALRGVSYPGFSRDIVSLGAVAAVLELGTEPLFLVLL